MKSIVPLHRRLVVLSIVPVGFVVLLGIMKWRAGHPALSKMDRLFRTALDGASCVYIGGEGQIWQHRTGFQEASSFSRQGYIVRDKGALHEMMETLHCTNRERPLKGSIGDMFIIVAIPNGPPQDSGVQWRLFFYSRDSTGSYVTFWDKDGQERPKSLFFVQSQSATRFEALIVRLAERAKAKGYHPEIMLGVLPFMRHPSPTPTASPQQQQSAAIQRHYQSAMQKGITFLRHGQLLQARQQFLQAFKLNPHSSDAANLLGRLAADIDHDSKKAESYYRLALRLNPKNLNAINDLGMLCYIKSDFVSAEKLYRQAIFLAPSWASPVLNLGLLYEKRKHDYITAHKFYRRAVQLAPKWDGAWLALASLEQFQLHDFADAERSYEAALRLNPKNAWGWGNYGAVLESEVKLFDAEEAYRQSLALNPQNAGVSYNLAGLLSSHRSYTEARWLYRTVIKLTQVATNGGNE